MPLYEYECEDGHRFEELRHRDERNNVVCPQCKRPVHIKISLSTQHKTAHPFRVVGHDGRVIHESQTTETTPLRIATKGGGLRDVKLR